MEKVVLLVCDFQLLKVTRDVKPNEEAQCDRSLSFCFVWILSPCWHHNTKLNRTDSTAQKPAMFLGSLISQPRSTPTRPGLVSAQRELCRRAEAIKVDIITGASAEELLLVIMWEVDSRKTGAPLLLLSNGFFFFSSSFSRCPSVLTPGYQVCKSGVSACFKQPFRSQPEEPRHPRRCISYPWCNFALTERNCRRKSTLAAFHSCSHGSKRSWACWGQCKPPVIQLLPSNISQYTLHLHLWSRHIDYLHVCAINITSPWK